MAGDRYHYFDALRASALLLGIMLHATMSFIAGFRDLGFPIADVSRSTTLELVFFVVHMFRMALFYFVAGFFARLLFERGGLGGFIRNRLARIALPLVVFFPVIMPLVILPVMWAAKQGFSAATSPQDASGPMAQGFPWGHFWFLYLLLVLYALVLAMRGLAQLIDRREKIRALLDVAMRAALKTRVAPALLAAPTAVLLYATSWWPQGGGIPAPLHGFIPNTPAVLAFGSALLTGWWFHRQPALLEFLRRDCKPYLAIAVMATGVALAIIGVKSHFQPIPMDPGTRALYAFAYMLAVWCWIFGLTGAAMRWLHEPSARWRYLADASYWMYLVHVPIVWGLQAWMMRWPVHWSIKFLLILGISGVLLLASYHYLARSTFVGKLLNGRKYPRSAAVASASSPTTG
jgi:glucan biosynthesis protein C